MFIDAIVSFSVFSGFVVLLFVIVVRVLLLVVKFVCRLSLFKSVESYVLLLISIIFVLLLFSFSLIAVGELAVSEELV